MNNDLISRQAAIDAIESAFDRETILNRFVRKIAISAVRLLPSVQPERKKDEWIPISKETNPTKSGWYLVTVHEDATNENKRFTGVAEFNATNGMWYDIDEPTDMYLRWMPFPEPYRGGEKQVRLIDADAFKAYMRGALEQTRRCYPDGGEWAEAVTEEFCRDIDEQPTVEERKKGRWLRYGEDGYPNNEDTVLWQCNQCLEQYAGRTKRIPNFCPNCGADMREET